MAYFIELEIPKCDPIPDKWYVLARHDRIYLTNQGDLEHEDFINLQDIEKIFYDTEVDAFGAIESYYRQYNKNYPYVSEHFNALKRNDNTTTTKSDSEIIESRVMEFI